MELSYCKYMVRNYPTLCRKLEALRDGQNRAGEPGGRVSGGISRPVERTALRELPPEEQKELEAVRRAIELTMTDRNWSIRMKLVEMVYWDKPVTLYQASERLFLSYRTAKNYNRDFLEAVRRAFGEGAG